jgi:hypothetical protein
MIVVLRAAINDEFASGAEAEAARRSVTRAVALPQEA